MMGWDERILVFFSTQDMKIRDSSPSAEDSSDVCS